MNKKKKLNKSGYPDEAIKILARCFYPSMAEFFNSEEGQRFIVWKIKLLITKKHLSIYTL